MSRKGKNEKEQIVLPIRYVCLKWGTWYFACICDKVPGTGDWDSDGDLSYVEVRAYFFFSVCG